MRILSFLDKSEYRDLKPDQSTALIIGIVIFIYCLCVDKRGDAPVHK